jgi:hypothetical protein
MNRLRASSLLMEDCLRCDFLPEEKRADIHEAFLALGCILICWKFLAGEDRLSMANC